MGRASIGLKSAIGPRVGLNSRFDLPPGIGPLELREKHYIRQPGLRIPPAWCSPANCAVVPVTDSYEFIDLVGLGSANPLRLVNPALNSQVRKRRGNGRTDFRMRAAFSCSCRFGHSS